MPEMDLILTAYYTDIQAVRRIATLKAKEASDDDFAFFITKAQAEIDAGLNGVYDVPFTYGEVPDKIYWLCADLAACFVIRALFTGMSKNTSGYADSLCDKAEAQLMALSDGDESLPGFEASRKPRMRSNTANQQVIFDLGPYKDALYVGEIDGVEGITPFDCYQYIRYVGGCC